MEVHKIHVVYLNESPMPTFFQTCVETWRRDYPHAFLHFWDANNLPPIRSQAVYDACWHFAGRTDVLRYELLHRFGGLYVDCDMMSLRPMDDLLVPVSAFSSAAPLPEDQFGLWHEICILGAEKEHPFYEYLLSRLPEWHETHWNRGTHERTGPMFYATILQEWRREVKPLSQDVCVFDPKLMIPFHFAQEHAGPADDLRSIYPDARCVHWWAGTWCALEQQSITNS